METTIWKSAYRTPHLETHATPTWIYLLSAPYRINLLSGPSWRRSDMQMSMNQPGEKDGPTREMVG